MYVLFCVYLIAVCENNNTTNLAELVCERVNSNINKTIVLFFVNIYYLSSDHLSCSFADWITCMENVGKIN